MPFDSLKNRRSHGNSPSSGGEEATVDRPDGRHIWVDLTAGKVPLNSPPGAEIVGGGWLTCGYLAVHLQGEGVDTGTDERQVNLGIGGATCKARVDESYDGSNPSVPVWFDVTLPDLGLTISESLSAFASEKTPEASMQSVQDAVHFFARGSLSAIRHLYGTGSPDDGVTHGEIYSATADKATTWDVFLGPPLAMAASHGRIADVAAAVANHKLFIPAFGEYLVEVLREPRLHWCKLYVFRAAPSAPVRAFVSIDNEGQIVPVERLGGFDLPEGMVGMARQFGVVRPVSTVSRVPSNNLRTVAHLTVDGTDIDVWAISVS